MDLHVNVSNKCLRCLWKCFYKFLTIKSIWRLLQVKKTISSMYQTSLLQLNNKSLTCCCLFIIYFQQVDQNANKSLASLYQVSKKSLLSLQNNLIRLYSNQMKIKKLLFIWSLDLNCPKSLVFLYMLTQGDGWGAWWWWLRPWRTTTTSICSSIQ